MYTHTKDILTAGIPLNKATQAVVLLHGRGGSAEDILQLGKHLSTEGMALLAPQATQHSWYPYGFMSPVERNQPALDSALAVVDELVESIVAAGIERNNIYVAGFSQGACLTLEYVTRHAHRYAGVIAFTGGLIGEQLNTANYTGSFDNTPFLITTGDADPHVPVSRVQESTDIIQKMQGNVTTKIYKNRPHTISQQEIELANGILRPTATA
ncbi:MAG: alpha/beta hydrolase [Bacteroidetes bacterium]|nr:alpha/beta hydrolase [Bacteroidota bacterium]